MILNGDDAMTLKDGKFVETTGLSISNRGTKFTFTLKGNKEELENVKLVLGYKAVV